MKEFVIDLDKNYTRPIIVLPNKMRALIDSGADLPMCNDADLLRNLYKTIFLTRVEKEKGPIGITQRRIAGTLFDVENFIFGEIVYAHLSVFVPDGAGFTTPFIISSSMLKGLIVELDYQESKMTVKIPDDNMVRIAQFQKNGETFLLPNQR